MQPLDLPRLDFDQLGQRFRVGAQEAFLLGEQDLVQLAEAGQLGAQARDERGALGWRRLHAVAADQTF